MCSDAKQTWWSYGTFVVGRFYFLSWNRVGHPFWPSPQLTPQLVRNRVVSRSIESCSRRLRTFNVEIHSHRILNDSAVSLYSTFITTRWLNVFTLALGRFDLVWSCSRVSSSGTASTPELSTSLRQSHCCRCRMRHADGDPVDPRRYPFTSFWPRWLVSLTLQNRNWLHFFVFFFQEKVVHLVLTTMKESNALLRRWFIESDVSCWLLTQQDGFLFRHFRSERNVRFPVFTVGIWGRFLCCRATFHRAAWKWWPSPPESSCLSIFIGRDRAEKSPAPSIGAARPVQFRSGRRNRRRDGRWRPPHSALGLDSLLFASLTLANQRRHRNHRPPFSRVRHHFPRELDGQPPRSKGKHQKSARFQGRE